MDENFLASTHVGSPDPKKSCPPRGERLLIAWKFPHFLFVQKLSMILTVRFWDQSEEILEKSIERMWGNTALNFFDRRILTYRIQVINDSGEIVETWEHHFWTKRIDFK